MTPNYENTMLGTELWAEMMSGRVYDAPNPLFVEQLNRVKVCLQDYNATRADQLDELERKIRLILGRAGKGIKVLQPFRCDYGCNISVGDNFFANFNLTVLDEAAVTIGDNVFIGPNVSIYTACHSARPEERNTGSEWSEPVTIGDSVWIGGSATILPGVTIGSNVTIGAGSVVTHDIPDNSIAVGNPARVIRTVS